MRSTYRIVTPFRAFLDHTCNYRKAELRKNEEDNGDFIVLSGNLLDLDDLATSDILLELPSVVYCREDCKGLCPKCGTTLNEKDCGCVLKQPDPRLAILSEFFKES